MAGESNKWRSQPAKSAKQDDCKLHSFAHAPPELRSNFQDGKMLGALARGCRIYQPEKTLNLGNVVDHIRSNPSAESPYAERGVVKRDLGPALDFSTAGYAQTSRV